MSRTRTMLRLLAVSLCPAALFCQVELVNNAWPNDPQGFKFYPDAAVTYESHVFRNDGSGIAGLPFQTTIRQYASQGYHTHEGSTVTRNLPVFLPPYRATGTTDANGIARSDVQLNGYAGWYTVCTKITSPSNILFVLSEKCVNNNTRYTVSLGRTPLVRYSGGLQPYDGASQVNQPQNYHLDPRHLCCSAQQDYSTHWVDPIVELQLLGASSKYKSDTAADGFTDLLDVTRISLPDGGIYDNDVAGVAPGSGNFVLNWDTRVFEEHARGVEADIALAGTQLQVTREFTALYFSSCKPGIFDPYGNLITYNPPDPYWKTQGVVHVTCSAGAHGIGLKKR